MMCSKTGLTLMNKRVLRSTGILAVLVGALGVSACSTCKPVRAQVDDYKAYDASRVDWGRLHPAEESYYTKRSHDPAAAEEGNRPQLALALSGGGQRAASVSIGFLGALSRGGVMDEVDLVSSVSGGSYAAYWWYTKHYWADRLGDRSAVDGQQGGMLFARYISSGVCERIAVSPVPDECRNSPEYHRQHYRFYYHNYNSGYLLSISQMPTKLDWADATIRWSEVIGKAIPSWSVSTPVSWVVNGAFDMKYNVKPIAAYYQNGIEREYGIFPLAQLNEDGDSRYANSARMGSGATTEPTMAQLFSAMQGRENKLPFWVINTTAAYSRSGAGKLFSGIPAAGYSHALANTVYEITPAYQGSPRFGYCDYATEDCPGAEMPELGRAIALSGAAVDRLGPTSNIAMDVFNLSLGQYIPNPAVPRSTRVMHRMLPFPLYLLDASHHDEGSPFIYLSDGGHADNLGLYAVVRRFAGQEADSKHVQPEAQSSPVSSNEARTVIVLDSEAETDMETRKALFQSLRQDRCALFRERRVLIDIPGIASEGDPICPEYLAPSASSFRTDHATKSVFVGAICRYRGDDVPERAGCKRNGSGFANDDDFIATVYYAKLSINADELDFKDFSRESCLQDQLINSSRRYSCVTADHYRNNRILEDGEFPHDGTADISYSPTQYQGYTALGYDLGREVLRVMRGNGAN